MHTCLHLCITTTLTLLLSTTVLSGSEWGGHVNGILGLKILEDNDWGPVSHQTELGVLFDYKGNDWPLSVSADWLLSFGEGSEGALDYEGLTSELHIGVRKYWNLENTDWVTYAGGGAAFIYASQTIDAASSSTDDSDTGIGYWINGGLFYRKDDWNFGIDLRISKADADLFGIDSNVGGEHLGFFAGLTF